MTEECLHGTYRDEIEFLGHDKDRPVTEPKPHTGVPDGETKSKTTKRIQTQAIVHALRDFRVILHNVHQSDHSI